MTDLQLNTTTNDLVLVNADLSIGISDGQQQECLLIAQKGSVKQFPDAGVGIENYLNESEIDDMLREIRFQFEQDGMVVNQLDYNEQTGQLNYDANYTS
jgi:hypothetical protein